MGIDIPLPEKIGEFADPQSPEAYFFFPAAVEKQILDIEELDYNDPVKAAMAVRNAQIPDKAGVVGRPSLSVVEGAYDLVPALRHGDKLIVGHGFKSAVDSESRLVRDDGLIVFSDMNGTVKVVAESVDPRRVAFNRDYRQIGERAFKFLGLEAPVFEISDVQPDKAVLQLPPRYF